MSSSSDRKPTPNQLSTHLPGPTAYLTGHNDKSGEAIIHSARPIEWHRYDDDKMAMAVAYTTSFPPDLNEDADVQAHDSKMAASSGKLGLVSGGGTVLRFWRGAVDGTRGCDGAEGYDACVAEP
ncbi:hypothetical protein LTS10_004290 [Elasticomyces elasticus]|nr:hypothetical protein LTS10_004290 [Elasticomyces elasticus]